MIGVVFKGSIGQNIRPIYPLKCNHKSHLDCGEMEIFQDWLLDGVDSYDTFHIFVKEHFIFSAFSIFIHKRAINLSW